MKHKCHFVDKIITFIAFFIFILVSTGIAFKSSAQSPVITTPSVNLQGITEDILTASNTGTLVSTLMSGAATDVNGDAIGIAVTSRDAANGTWQFFESGIWWNFDRTAVASPTQALLLPPAATIRFTPASNYNGSATFTFRAWDQRSGTAFSTGNTTTNGGNTAYSGTTGTATIAITSINDAPGINSTVGIPGIMFDGANDHVTFSNPSISGDYTIEAWVYVNQHQTWSRIVDMGNGAGSNNVLFAFQGGSNYLVMETYTSAGGGILASPSAVPTGVWKHLACVNNGAGTGYLYIDGVQVASGTQKTPANISRSLNYIARSNWGQDSYFNGTIREVRIWDVARTQTQISQNKDIPLLGNETGLKVYYRTDEGSGTTLNDDSGNGKTGTLQNGPTWTTYGTPLSNLLLTEDATAVIPGFEALDVDAGTNSITFTISASNGVINVLTDVVNGITAGDVIANNSSSVSITTTITKINATLAGNGFVYIPNANYNGSDEVTMNLVDNGHSGSGGILSTAYSFDVTITPVNDSPTVTSTALTAINEDVAYSYTMMATDPDAGNVLSYSAPVLPSWLTFNTTTRVLSGTPTNAQVGTHNVTLRVNDGLVNTDQAFVITVANVNDAPTISSTAVTAVNEDAAYTYTIVASDVDAGNVLTYSAFVLPAWLSFDPTTRILSGTPANSAVGSHNVTLRINDGTVNVDQVFIINVVNINDAPTITSTAVTAVNEDLAYAYTMAASDVDVGNILTYSAPILPSWLTFNTTTRVLSGTPTNTEVGMHNVTLRVNDGTVNVDQAFVITVTNVNDAPTVTSTAVTSINEDAAYTYAIVAADVDAGNTLTYSAPVLPAWLTFNTTTRILSGTPTNSVVGVHNVTLRVNDGTVDVDQVFEITVTNTNDAPVISSTAGVSVDEDAAYTYTLTASDVDAGAVLTYTAPVLPSWLTFNTTTGTLSGTPTNSAVGVHNVTLRINDGTVNVDHIFTITVANTNDAPAIISVAVTAVNEDAAYTYTINAADVDAGAVLTYTAPVIPSWLTFNTTTLVLSGTPTNGAVGTHHVTLRVSDGTVNVDQTFTIAVANINDAPVINSSAVTSVDEDAAYSYTVLASDLDVGNVLTYSAFVLPDWLAFNTTSHILSGTPTNADVGVHHVTLRINDGTVNVDQAFTITVANTNDAPTITSTASTAVSEDSDYSYTVIASDIDAGAVLTYTAQVLPTWLSFNTTTHTLSGTPTNGEVGTHNVTLRVNDGTVAIDQTFILTVVNINDAPIINSTAVTSVNEDAAYTYTISASDVDAGTVLSYSAPVLPNWLTFNTTTRILSGTPTNDVVGVHHVTLRASDGTVNVDQAFTVTVSNINDAPAISSVAVTSIHEDAAYSYTFSASDIDAGDVLTYSAEVLPSWLTFNTTTRILSGTPENNQVGTHNVTLRVSDGTVNVDQVFTVTVANTNDAPVISSSAVTSVNEDEAYEYALVATDVDAGDVLTYSAPVLPPWLTFNTTTRILSATPTNNEVGTHSVTLRVYDGTVNVDQTFILTVANSNDSPVITSTAVTSINEDAAYVYTFAASDVDAGATLTFTAPVLPSWLTFNTTTKILAGIPTNSQVGTHNVTLRVNDGTVNIDQSFVVTVVNTNDAPTITSTAVTSINEDAAYVYTIVASDVDAGSALTYATPVLPAWLSFNTTTKALTGSPTNEEVGTHAVTLRVNDGTVNTDQTFSITVVNTNDAPVVNSTAVTTVDEDAGYAYTILASDVDAGTTLTYEAFVLPSWLTFNETTQELSGTPANDDVGTHAVTLRVKDGTINVDQVYTITVANTNDVPVITSTMVVTAEENEIYTYTITATDVDADDILTYSASVLPSWLTFNTTTKVLSGTPGNSHVGTHNATLRVNDGTVNVDQTFVITVANANDNPTVTSVAVTTVNEDDSYTYSFTGADVDAMDVLTYSAPVLPAWLTFNTTTGILSGTPTNNEVGVHPVTLRVSDGTVDTDEVFSITVANTNDAPVINSVAVIAANEDDIYTYTISATDVDLTNVLTYAASVLPNWLTFDATTLLLSGTPTNDEVGSHVVTLLVNDGTVDVEQTFTITVANVNDAPVINSTAITVVEEDVLYAYTFAATDIDVADQLTYFANELPEWLSFDPETGVLSGTPTNDAVGSYEVILQVGDATVQVEQSFIISVSNINDAPVITSAAITIAKETFNYSYSITAVDADEDSQLIFSASALPSWLTFNNATATLQGTPSPSEAGTYAITLTVSDGIISVDQAFAITVAPNISPLVQANQVFSIAEKSAKGTDVGFVSATDADGDAFMNWTIVDGNTDNAFSINAASGLLAVENEILDFEESASFTLVVTVSDGFTTSLPTPVTVNINDVMEGLVLYSAFSPNGDGINDTFEIDGLEAYPNCYIKIFNSDGIEMFSNVGYTAQWDGFYKGKEMPLGTYFYLINLNDGSKKTLNGHFMIIK